MGIQVYFVTFVASKTSDLVSLTLLCYYFVTR
uniref:Uncharacterized protein n=1 Tax=Podoviridae sp. ctKmJ5 TaxID=2827732 RepID=A0A8S5SYQ1_9CAUD|nr:MAG TPA: hypothetical protein [Podoviridae sp. ctKmJ5]